MSAFVVGCVEAPAELDAAVTSDANDCAVELEYTCEPTARVCCHGAWLSFSDGPCWSPPDSDAPDGGFPDASLACEVDGASECVDGVRAECHAGQWEATNTLCLFPGCS